MKKFLVAASAAALAVGFSAPASAAAVLYCSNGGIDLVNDGCISGTSSAYPGGGDGIYNNAGGGDPLSAVQAAIAAATGTAPTGLALYGKSDKDASLFSFTGVSPADLAGTWDVLDNDVLIKYITVKAANSFALFELPGLGANSGSFDTLGILNNGGQQPNVSHISFWLADSVSGGVPEPSTWALMILGFGLVGGIMRKRQKVTVSYA